MVQYLSPFFFDSFLSGLSIASYLIMNTEYAGTKDQFWAAIIHAHLRCCHSAEVGFDYISNQLPFRDGGWR